MSDRVIDLNKVKFLKSVGRDLLLYERLAGHELDLELHRCGGIQGLLVPSKGRGTISARAKLFLALLAYGITEQELFEALVDSVARRGGTVDQAKLHFSTSTSIYMSEEVQRTLKDRGFDKP